MLNRTVAPPIVDAIDFNLTLPACQKLTLKNGTEVYLVDGGSEEVLQLELVFYAGNWFEERNLVAATANYMLKNGTSTKTAFQINEYFDYYGSFLNRACYNETATLSLHCLNKHIDKLLPVMRELIVDSVIPEEELAIYKQNMKQRLKVSLQKSDFVAGRLIDTYLFGTNHPYGRFSTEAEFDALTREEVLAFYDRYYRNGKMVVFAAGKIPSNFELLLNEYFGNLSTSDIRVEPKAIDPIEERKFRVSNDENGVQGSIRIARPFPNRHHPDFIRVQTLNALFGGFFGSRLMSNIREDKGYTYGIHSYVINHLHDTAWMISTEAGKDVAEATITEVYNEMRDLREELVDEEELLLVKNYLLGSILGDLDGPFQIIGRWKNLILNGLDENYFYKSVDTIKKMTAEEIKELANKYLKEEDFYELVVV